MAAFRVLAPLVVLVLASPSLPVAAQDADARWFEPVVLLGARLPGLSVAAAYVERPPAPFADEARDGARVGAAGDGTPPAHVFAFRWDGGAFVEVPVQVDERFPRYLTNYASAFAPYSQSDLELTYAFDVEGTRRTGEVPGRPDVAALADPSSPTTPDPVAGLDADDEVAFLLRDAGPRAPTGASPAGVDALHEVRLVDPLGAPDRWIYLGRSATLDHAFALYVSYARDPDADVYVRSNHGGYGGAPGGTCHPGDGVDAPFGPAEPACPNRRPKDSATVTTPVYAFHYAGRWKLDGISVEGGPSLVDRWKGRAFQQREGNAADIGGFEDENDWTRSSVTLGERAGPVRVLRETWGADSGTHVTRLDAFYPDSFTQTYHMRVHPVPPDGVYAFWDHRAGVVTRYHTAVRPEGVPVDGVNDELYGTNSEWQQDHLGETYFLIDTPDPTLAQPVANEAWDAAAGPWGTMVSYLQAPRPQSGVLTSYYRDDATFLDGTGSEPGSFGAHGIHFFFTSDTDNAFLPAPVNEFVAVQHAVLVPGEAGSAAPAVAARLQAPVLAEVAER